MTVMRPVPRTDAVSQGFWDAAARGKLAIQRCVACGGYQHPPRPICRACGSIDLAFVPVSGKGQLWSWTVTYHKVLCGFDAVMPYTCMLIELREQNGLLLLSDLIGREALRGSLILGMRMRVFFPERGADGKVLPQFRPVAESRA